MTGSITVLTRRSTGRISHRGLAVGLAAALSLAGLSLGLPLAAGAESLVIEGGTVHPMNGEPFVGRVVVTDGVIAAAGPDVAVPAGATRIDATGKQVWPGLFDSLSQLGLVEISAVASTDDEAEMGTYNPQLRAATAVHPASELIPVARANGITHTVIAPLSDDGGVIAGQSALVNLAGWTIEEMAIDPALEMVMTWPEIVTRRFDFATFSLKNTPFAEAKENAEKKANELRDWFEAARHYGQAAAASSPRLERDLKLAALAEVVGGRQPLVIRAQAKRDIEAAVAFAEQQQVRMILAGGRDAWKTTDLLAKHQIPVILQFPSNLPEEQDDPYDRSFRTAGDLVAAGVKIAFASGAGGGGDGPGGPHDSRTVPFEAATAAAYGLAPEDAMRALTLWPAQIHGVSDKLGSIEPGKIANLIVTDGSPLVIDSHVEHLIIAGREVSTDNRQRELWEKYRAR
jgi:imidazolonepropionase-like amidohydrolase